MSEPPEITVEEKKAKPPLSAERSKQLELARAKAIEVRKERAAVKKAEKEQMKEEWEARKKLTEKKLAELNKPDDEEWEEHAGAAEKPAEHVLPEKPDAYQNYGVAPPSPHPSSLKQQQQRAGYYSTTPSYPQRPPPPPGYHPYYNAEFHHQQGYHPHDPRHPGNYPREWTQPPRLDHPPRTPQYHMAAPPQPHSDIQQYPMKPDIQQYPIKYGEKSYGDMNTAELEEKTAAEEYRKRIKNLKREVAYRSVFPDVDMEQEKKVSHDAPY